MTDPRCPQCSALVRAGSSWCTLCHADLRPPEERPVAAPAPTEPVEPAAGHRRHARHARGGSVQTMEPLGASEPAEPVDGIELVDPAEAAPPVESLEDIDLDAMFALLAAEHTDPLLSDLPGRLSTKSSKTVVIAGGMVLITVVGLIAMVILGSIFG